MSRVGDVTRQILDGWNEDDEDGQVEATETETEEAPVVEEEEVEVNAEETPTDETATEEPEESDEEGEAETEQEGEEEEEEKTPGRVPSVEDFLAKYGGDVEAALRGAAEMYRTFGRRDDEKLLLQERIGELQEELAHVQSFGGMSPLLSAEQHAWVGEAVDSGNARAYVQQAIRAREYDLARAVCDAWAPESPYEAMRMSQAVDLAQISADENASRAEQNGAVLDHGALMNVLVDNFPEMPQYEDQMVSTLASLGPMHPLVQDARSNDPQTAARGIIGVYEIARAQHASVAQAKDEAKKSSRQKADDARAKAVVSSSSKSPSAAETPRNKPLMPGLTLDQLEEEWVRD